MSWRGRYTASAAATLSAKIFPGTNAFMFYSSSNFFGMASVSPAIIVISADRIRDIRAYWFLSFTYAFMKNFHALLFRMTSIKISYFLSGWGTFAIYSANVFSNRSGSNAALSKSVMSFTAARTAAAKRLF